MFFDSFMRNGDGIHDTSTLVTQRLLVCFLQRWSQCVTKPNVWWPHNTQLLGRNALHHHYPTQHWSQFWTAGFQGWNLHETAQTYCPSITPVPGLPWCKFHYHIHCSLFQPPFILNVRYPTILWVFIKPNHVFWYPKWDDDETLWGFRPHVHISIIFSITNIN